MDLSIFQNRRSGGLGGIFGNQKVFIRTPDNRVSLKRDLKSPTLCLAKLRARISAVFLAFILKLSEKQLSRRILYCQCHNGDLV